jgi:acyl-homoserine-lactone acylase
MWAMLWMIGCTKSPDGTTPTGPTDPYDVEIGPYSVEIRTTSWGVPHIVGDDSGSVAFGMGWAHARDHLCTLADQFVKVRSERSKYFGPGEDEANVDNDFGWLALGVHANAVAGFLSLPERERQVIVGYSAGYNRYLEDTPAEERDPRCGGAEWVFPITHIDLLAYYLHLGQLASGHALVKEVGNAQPPGLRSVGQRPPPPLSVLEHYREPPIGSNGWAIGGDRTAGGRGMLLSNTHFPSEGERQWWEAHLTIPGELDVYGASLIGSAAINIGFNENVAWTHTVSNTPRFIVYQLRLDLEDPTRYRYDGRFVDMESTDYTIDVLQDDGSMVPVTRTLYRTQYGPVFNAPLVGWNTINAYSWRDVNANNLGLIPSFAGMNYAADQAEFEAAHRDHQGIPWVHTMFAEQDGDVLYLDSATTPNFSPEADLAYAAYKESDVISGAFAGFGVIVVDGSDPVYTWVEDPRAAQVGAVPFDDTPRLERRDFVNNSNENYWLANPLSPMTGFPLLYGSTGAPAAPRTKMNNRLLLEEDGASGADHRFDLDELEAAALSCRGSMAEDLLDEVVARCTGVTTVDVEIDGSPVTVDVGPACAALAGWDGRVRVESTGAQVWRELVGSGLNSFADLTTQGRFYADVADVANPIYTPTTLAPATKSGDPVLENLAVAAYHLGLAGVPVDAPLGDIQYRVKDGVRIPTLGGIYTEGVISISTFSTPDSTLLTTELLADPVINAPTDLTAEGYLVNNGNSWIMAMEFTDDGPVARAVMTYSQSENPESPHFSDQSELYGASQSLRPVLFREADILADPELEIVNLTLPAP